MNRNSVIPCARRVGLVVTIFLAVAIGAIAQVIPQKPAEIPTTPSEKDVAEIISELSAGARSRRAAAEKRLLELGPRVLPLLPAPEVLPTASVRETVLRIRVELERQRAIESSRASRVTLEGSRLVTDWLDEIHRQTGNRVVLDPMTAIAVERRNVDLNIEDEPFWPALQKLTNRAVELGKAYAPRLRPGFNSNNQLTLSEEGSPELADASIFACSGPFRVHAKSVQRRKVFGTADREMLRITLEIAAAPRLRPLFLQVAAENLVAVTDENRPLKPFTPEARHEIPLSQGRRVAQIQADFELPASWKGSTVDLRGKAVMTTAAASEPVQFTRLHELVGNRGVGVARRRGGVTVTLHRVLSERSAREEGPARSNDVRLQTVVSYDVGGPAFESHRTWIIHNEAWLETNDGTRLPMTSQETTLQADGAVGVDYLFHKLPRPLEDYRFVYMAPTLIVDVPIEFTLKAIPVGK